MEQTTKTKKEELKKDKKYIIWIILSVIVFFFIIISSFVACSSQHKEENINTRIYTMQTKQIKLQEEDKPIISTNQSENVITVFYTVIERIPLSFLIVLFIVNVFILSRCRIFRY